MRAFWIVCALLAAAPLALAQQRGAEYWQILQADRAAFRMRTVAMLPEGPERGVSMVYGDRYGFLRVVHIGDGAAREVWQSRPLEGNVMEVLVEDLDGDNSYEIIARTQSSKIYVFDQDSNVTWESQGGEYSNIEALAIANVDEDFAYELVIKDAGIIIYVDGLNFQNEWRSNVTYRGDEMLVGNVDTEPILEIVLNSGEVISAETGEVEYRASGFQPRIELLDIDGDGIQEILTWNEGQPLRIFDADEQREKPLR